MREQQHNLDRLFRALNRIEAALRRAPPENKRIAHHSSLASDLNRLEQRVDHVLARLRSLSENSQPKRKEHG